MTLRALLVLPLLVGPLGTTGAAQTGRVEVEAYVLTAGPISPAFYFCDTDEGNIGGVCFRVVDGERFVRLEVEPARREATVGTARFYDRTNELVGRAAFCSVSEHLAIPPAAEKLVVLLGRAAADPAKAYMCSSALVATPVNSTAASVRGIVTAEFY